MAMLLMLKAAVPVLVSVTVWAVLVVPTFWLPKFTLVGLRLTTGVGTVVPINLFKILAVICWLALLAKPRLQSQKPSLKPLSTPHDHEIVPAAKTIAPLDAVYNVASDQAFTPLSDAGTNECPTCCNPAGSYETNDERLGSFAALSSNS